MRFTIFVVMSIFFLLSCVEKGSDDNTLKQRGRPLAHENGKIFEQNGRKFLWGGKNNAWHFDITESILKDEQYHYGIGREEFLALIVPEFMSVEEANNHYVDSSRFLLLKIGDDVRAYGIDLLTRHEVVNDVVNGAPIMAAYCILADLGAIYDRRLLGRTFTFALSGYTYFDPEVWDGMDGFVFWDRETESTWWPLIGRAVSGPLLNTELKVYDKEDWSQTTWGEIKSEYDIVKVLRPGQNMTVPLDWPKYDDIVAPTSGSSGDAVPPRWGENASLTQENK